MKLKVSNVCQLFNKAKYTTETISGITWTNNNDGTITANGTATAESNYLIKLDLPLGHKYLVCGCPQGGGSSSYLFWGYYIDSIDQGNFQEYGDGRIISTKDFGYGNSFYIHMTYRNGQTATNQIWKPQLFDLTEMYGAGHEPTTVAQFRQDFPNEMYDYSPECWKRLKELRYKTETRNLLSNLFVSPTNLAGVSYDKQSGIFTIASNDKSHIGFSKPVMDFDTSIPVGTQITVTIYCVSGKYRATEGDNTAIGGYHKTDDLSQASWQGVVVLPSGIDLTGKIFTVTWTVNEPLNAFWIYAPKQIDIIEEDIRFRAQLELGSTSSPYQPYGYLSLRRGKFIVNKEPVQLLDKLNYPATLTQYGVTFTNNGDGTITANGTPNEVYTQYDIQIPQFKEVKNDHKYVLFSGINDIDVSFVECIFWLGRQDSSYFVTNCAETKFADTVGFVIPQGEYPLYQKIALRVRQGYTANNLVFKPQLFDLTAMYGEGNEPTTVEQFRTDYPNEIYEYNPFNAVSFH